MYAPDMRKKEICAVGHRLYEKNMVVANDGNISWRTGENEILITPSRICKGDLTPELIITVDMQGNILEGSGVVSTELQMHLYAYRSNASVRAIVHAHPFYATVLAVAGHDLHKHIYPTGYSFLGDVPLTPYGTSTTEELAKSIETYLANGHKALLLANHGALTCDKNLWDTYYLMERLENYAAIYYAAQALGGGRELTKDEEARLAAKIARQKQAGLL